MKKRFAGRLEASRSIEQGFTLLELLVSMVILSILVATASQFYLQHRRKAWEAQVRSSIRHMAGAENYFMFAEGAPAFTRDLDDLYLVGYRWNDGSVRPYVALATNQTFCVQVHSAHDPSIVWHFSSEIGRPQPGPATPRDCGDPDVLGTYIAGLPPETAGRDGRPSVLSDGYSTASTSGTDGSYPDGESSVEEGEFGPGSGTTADGAGSGTGDGTGESTTVVEATPAFGTEVGTSGSNTTDGSGSSGGSASGSTSGCTGGGSGSGSTSGTNHPSGHDRDSESGGSGDQGASDSDPDGDENDGADKPGEDGGADTGDQDGNNGSGNDSDFEDDNEGPDRDGTPVPGTSC